MACRRSVPDLRRAICLVAVALHAMLPRQSAVAQASAEAEFAAGPSGMAPERVLGGIPGGMRLAATANGQAVRCLLADQGAVASFEPGRPADRRNVVGPGTPGTCLAIGCLPGDVVAVVVREGEQWWLRTYRIEPGSTADPAAPLQEVTLGAAAGDSGPIGLVVSTARGWLALTGLPPPLPPILRAPVAGARIGPLSDRSCPKLPAGWRPVAATVSPRDEFVLALEPLPPEGKSTDPAAGPAAARTAHIGFYDLSGRELARLEAGVARLQAIAFDRAGATLCVAGRGLADERTGVWRLEAIMREGRQAVRPVLVASHPTARDLVAGPDRGLIMLAADEAGTLLAIDPTPPLPAAASGDMSP